MFGQLAVSKEPGCGWFVIRVKVSHRLFKHHKAVCFLLYLARTLERQANYRWRLGHVSMGVMYRTRSPMGLTHQSR